VHASFPRRGLLVFQQRKNIFNIEESIMTKSATCSEYLPLLCIHIVSTGSIKQYAKFNLKRN